MSGIARFEPYGPPRTTIAAAVRAIDDDTDELVALRRENRRLRAENQLLTTALAAERKNPK